MYPGARTTGSDPPGVLSAVSVSCLFPPLILLHKALAFLTPIIKVFESLARPATSTSSGESPCHRVGRANVVQYLDLSAEKSEGRPDDGLVLLLHIRRVEPTPVRPLFSEDESSLAAMSHEDNGVRTSSSVDDDAPIILKDVTLPDTASPVAERAAKRKTRGSSIDGEASAVKTKRARRRLVDDEAEAPEIIDSNLNAHDSMYTKSSAVKSSLLGPPLKTHSATGAKIAPKIVLLASSPHETDPSASPSASSVSSEPLKVAAIASSTVYVSRVFVPASNDKLDGVAAQDVSMEPYASDRAIGDCVLTLPRRLTPDPPTASGEPAASPSQGADSSAVTPVSIVAVPIAPELECVLVVANASIPNLTCRSMKSQIQSEMLPALVEQLKPDPSPSMALQFSPPPDGAYGDQTIDAPAISLPPIAVASRDVPVAAYTEYSATGKTVQSNVVSLDTPVATQPIPTESVIMLDETQLADANPQAVDLFAGDPDENEPSEKSRGKMRDSGREEVDDEALLLALAGVFGPKVVLPQTPPKSTTLLPSFVLSPVTPGTPATLPPASAPVTPSPVKGAQTDAGLSASPSPKKKKGIVLDDTIMFKVQYNPNAPCGVCNLDLQDPLLKTSSADAPSLPGVTVCCLLLGLLTKNREKLAVVLVFPHGAMKWITPMPLQELFESVACLAGWFVYPTGSRIWYNQELSPARLYQLCRHIGILWHVHREQYRRASVGRRSQSKMEEVHQSCVAQSRLGTTKLNPAGESKSVAAHQAKKIPAAMLRFAKSPSGSPTKGQAAHSSLSSPTSYSADYSLAYDAKVPVYDAINCHFDINVDLENMHTKLQEFAGEIPSGMFVIVGYSASTFMGKAMNYSDKTTHVGLNVLWVIVCGMCRDGGDETEAGKILASAIEQEFDFSVARGLFVPTSAFVACLSIASNATVNCTARRRTSVFIEFHAFTSWLPTKRPSRVRVRVVRYEILHQKADMVSWDGAANGELRSRSQAISGGERRGHRRSGVPGCDAHQMVTLFTTGLCLSQTFAIALSIVCNLCLVSCYSSVERQPPSVATYYAAPQLTIAV
ncbi:hypothetical protein B0H17DRAFT_1123520 [Mycena rosella]|uniref:Uncharacterized protein n=1 Tax=Mycena rosella TaxID=1033263 RepID=A0AAD7H1W1_MYCRO|nr:hypothetical protein B0H17DRAFT_1123520 [Mycena rosella]